VKPTIPHDAMGDFFRGLDVYLCMSDHEGLPTPGIEAAACGIPVISTRVGVMTEIIQNGGTGWLIEQDVDEAAARLRWMNHHRAERIQMGERMAEVMKAYTWPSVVSEWLNPVREVMGC